MSKLERRSVTVVERENDWLINWPNEPRSVFPRAEDNFVAAAEAQKAILTKAAAEAEAGISTAYFITWEPCSPIGRRIVKAITDTKAKFSIHHQSG